MNKNSLLQTKIFIQLCEDLELPIPTVEHRFHKIRKWRFDICWTDYMVALEVEGGVFSGGRHTRGAGFLGDMEKYNTATLMGWRILRVQPSQLLSTETIKMIRKILTFN